MGIKKLFTFLNNNNLYKIYPYLNDLIDELNIDKKRLLVGVDGNLFCYKYSHSYDNMLIGFFNQVLKFLSNKIIPLYIFDGGTIQEKENTNLNRYQRKIFSKYKLDQLENIIENNDNIDINTNSEINILKKKLEKKSIQINKKDIKLLLELFDLLHIPYIFSHGEGEYLAVLLNKYNIIDMLLTDDTDPIPAGIIKTIKFYNNNVYFLETQQVLNKFNLTASEFCDFCILLGSDYSTFYHGLKPFEVYDLILKHKNIENLIDNNLLNNINPDSLVIINKIRNIYNLSFQNEKNMFINPNDHISPNYNIIIDHLDLNYYSNILLEYWDDFIDILKNDLNDLNNLNNQTQTNLFKFNINEFVKKKKFNIKNIVKFIKNNINDITEEEISNAIISFEFLNTFGI